MAYLLEISIGNIIAIISAIFGLVGTIAGIIIYIIRQEGRLNVFKVQLAGAKETQDRLSNENVAFKLKQDGFQQTISRMEQAQSDMKNDVHEMKSDIKILLTK